MISLGDAQAARTRIQGRVHRTPLMTSEYLARECGVASFALKCESFQKTGSFKARGALNAISQLTDEAKARGVVSVSAGNHAAALAWAAATAGVRCTVVMPATASKSKAEASRGYGAEIILHGTGAEAFAKANELAETKGFTFIHPFDDDRIIAGTATCGLELIEQCERPPSLVVIPIGGGGLISGMAFGIKQASPGTRVVGVEPEGAAVMRKSLDQGAATRLDTMSTIADGLAAPMAGVRNFEMVQEFVDEVILVNDQEIADAMKILLQRCKLLAEPGGAAATAAMLSKKISVAATDSVVCVLSGGNVDLDRLCSIVA